MKNFLTWFCLALFISCSSSGKLGSLTKADKEAIADIKSSVEYLADDRLEGRRTGTQGEVLAMNYIAGRFEKAGLEPKGTNGFIQEFTINDGKSFDSSLVAISINDLPLKLTTDYFPLSYSGTSSFSAPGSPALREKGEVWFLDVNEMIEENKANPHFDIDDAIKKAAQKNAAKGAKALLVFNSSAKVDNIQFNRFDTSASIAIPVMYITKTAMASFIKDGTATYDFQVKSALGKKQRQARNVVGFINNNATNTVIIGAHYDHLGYGEDGSALDGAGSIHNGADDNASGVAALIHLANLLRSSGAKNNNYLFIAFSGEELGLRGSKFWLENPSVKISPNYMINMDMVGRYDSARKLTIGGYGTSPSWANILSSATLNGMAVKFDSSGAGPSDHTSFYRRNIPVLFFFTNSHSDYHKATDDADKINYHGELNIVKLIYSVIAQADNQGKLAFAKTAEQQMGKGSFSVSLGVMPDYGYTGTGVRIDGVSKGKQAERIGLQAGDVLLQLGDYKFVDVQSYMQVLNKFKAGDKVHILK